MNPHLPFVTSLLAFLLTKSITFVLNWTLELWLRTECAGVFSLTCFMGYFSDFIAQGHEQDS